VGLGSEDSADPSWAGYGFWDGVLSPLESVGEYT